MITKIGSKIQKVLEIFFRKRIILNIINFKAKNKRVNLNWAPICVKKFKFITWKSDSKKQNLGDYLAIPIFEYMVNKNHIDSNKKISETKHLYTIGSIILLGHQNATIWGSGILFSEPKNFIWKRNKYRELDIRCVRGPETLRRLTENGYDTSKCVMGDPGVLLPLIYKPTTFAQKKEYSVIIHMSKDFDVQNKIDILTDNWQTTIDEIYNSKLIISSSLHGIILAESYGIPAILLDKFEFNDLFKYNDYYYSTGRYEYPVCRTIEEALNTPPAPLPDLSKLQENLINSFPIDLWN